MKIGRKNECERKKVAFIITVKCLKNRLQSFQIVTKVEIWNRNWKPQTYSK